ncbi:hypothetical protein [Candidatus Nesciobacter abundans]|uniref:Uncharacterized protein n=1 Tax=Candidatus Nesciobacter abundans TaxID=2601668 RepID=A0A5C0UGL3_9PROT|nr:hypothetical protein [Candidatus Nesciobacter abundans]QEK38949.1 hypothetical protein FZC36_00660 [Candidatus Nesciobacter abundans]
MFLKIIYGSNSIIYDKVSVVGFEDSDGLRCIFDFASDFCSVINSGSVFFISAESDFLVKVGISSISKKDEKITIVSDYVNLLENNKISEIKNQLMESYKTNWDKENWFKENKEKINAILG